MKVTVVAALCLLAVATVEGHPLSQYESTRNVRESEPVQEYSSVQEDLPIQEGSPVEEDSSEEEALIEEALSFYTYATPIPILVNERQIYPNGAYSFRIEQGDDIRRWEISALDELTGQFQTTGEYSFIHPDGSSHELSYVADQNGFQPSSDMIPTPHPLEPWHLEQIAFAEAQKRTLAAEEASSASTSEIAEAPAVGYTYAAPVAEETVSALGAEKTDVAPAADFTTSALAANEVTSVRATGKTTNVQPAEESPSVPATGEYSVTRKAEETGDETDSTPITENEPVQEKNQD